MVIFGVILEFIVSKEGKLPDPKKIDAIMNMLVPQNSQQIQVFNGMVQFYKCFIKKFTTIMAPITTHKENIKFFVDKGVLESLGAYKVKIY